MDFAIQPIGDATHTAVAHCHVNAGRVCTAKPKENYEARLITGELCVSPAKTHNFHVVAAIEIVVVAPIITRHIAVWIQVLLTQQIRFARPIGDLLNADFTPVSSDAIVVLQAWPAVLP